MSLMPPATPRKHAARLSTRGREKWQVPSYANVLSVAAGGGGNVAALAA